MPEKMYYFTKIPLNLRPRPIVIEEAVTITHFYSSKLFEEQLTIF
jgi:hypothetical protein